MSRRKRANLALACALGLVAPTLAGCEPLLGREARRDDASKTPILVLDSGDGDDEEGKGKVHNDAAHLDDNGVPRGFFGRGGRTGGWSSEAASIERDLGVGR